MKKKILWISIMFLLLCIISMTLIIILRRQDTITQYEGKWKVTKQLSQTIGRTRIDNYAHHSLGRTVILEGTSVKKSIQEWPFYLEWSSEEYDVAKIVRILEEDIWLPGVTVVEIEGFLDDEKIQFIQYLNNDIVYDYFIILDSNYLAYSLAGGHFLLEQFHYCNPKVKFSDLIGEWEVAWLDSYENSYEGGFEEIEEVKKVYGEKMDALQGTDFSAEEWLGTIVSISEDAIEYSDLTFQINSVEESRQMRETFEKQMDIHDGLSIYDEEITVCAVKNDVNKEMIIVPINADKAVMQIEEGWFMLKKKS